MPPDFLTQKGLSYNGPEFDLVADDLQGNILKSHGRNHSSHIFFTFKPNKVAEAKTFIKSFEHLVTSARKQKADTKDFEDNKTQHIFTAFYLSAAGYTYLGIPANHTPNRLKGMKDSAAKLGDNLNDWDNGFKQGVHGMILIAFGGKARAQLLERETFAISNHAMNTLLKPIIPIIEVIAKFGC